MKFIVVVIIINIFKAEKNSIEFHGCILKY